MNKKGKITIGIPVFNNEKIIKKRIDDITAQSYQNFTIIISDNNSTDKTREICEKISQNDDRIVFFHHEQNMGPYWNFNFVLDKAETEYFVWVAGDDIWSKKFLEKNIKFLEENDDYVGSIGETSLFNRNYNENIKLIENSKKYKYVMPINDNDVDKRITSYLNFNMGVQFYSIFRTKDIKFANFYNEKPNFGMWQADFATILKILKRGKLHVDLESFYYKEVSETSHSITNYMKKLKFTKWEIQFSKTKFSTWFFKEFGSKLFMKNIQFFIILNLKWIISIFGEQIRMCKRKITGQPTYW
jgi:glycosyltransferase involved in cell wall biosynthesis